MTPERGQQWVPGAVIPPRAETAPAPPASGRRAERLNTLIRRHRAAVVAVEQTEADYRAVHAEYARKIPQEAWRAEAMASDDLRARKAVADGAWQRDRALMYGIAVLVELLAGGEPC